MKRLSLIVMVFLASMLGFAQNSFASADCTPVYGGGEICNNGTFLVEKSVLNPKTNKFVSNLDKTDATYQPSFIITFQVKVTNTGTSTINSITLKDVFPKGITYSSGPGTFDSATQTLSFDLTNLQPGKSMLFTIIGRVDANFFFPQGEDVVCEANQIFATTDTKKSNQSSSSFCVAKTASAVNNIVKAAIVGNGLSQPPYITKTPATGPETAVVFSFIPLALAGFALRKKAHS